MKQSGIIVEQAQLSADNATPTSGFSVIYPRTDGHWYVRNPGGEVLNVTKYISGLVSDAQTQLDRKRKVFNVLDYGADATFTTDSTTAIQSAINACYAAGGGIVYFPIGHYMVNGSLVTSMDGTNPNAQLVIPLTESDEGSYPMISFEGESPVNWSAENISLIPRNDLGSIVESTILGDGYVFGSPNYDGPVGNSLNYTWWSFKNLDIRVRSKTSGTEISHGMSGIDSYSPRSITLERVRVTTQSAEVSVLQPESHTVGIRLPHWNNNASIYGTGIVITGFYTGMIACEHMNFQELIIGVCYNGLYLPYMVHSGYISQYTSEGCVNHIYVGDEENPDGFDYVAGPMDLHINSYNVEHTTTAGGSHWYNFQNDVLFENTSSNTRILIEYAHVVIPNYGKQAEFITNAPGRVTVGHNSERSNYLYRDDLGNWAMNALSDIDNDNNLLQLTNTAGSIGIVGGPVTGLAKENTAFFGMRGLTYSIFPNQRGSVAMGAGVPDTPTEGEGEITFYTNNAARIKIGFEGTIFFPAYGGTGGGSLSISDDGEITIGGGGGSGLQGVTTGAGNNVTDNLTFFTGANNIPTTGSGAFIYGSGGDGHIGGYNWATSAYTKLLLEASKVVLVTPGSSGAGDQMMYVNDDGEISFTSMPGGGGGIIPSNRYRITIEGQSNAFGVGLTDELDESPIDTDTYSFLLAQSRVYIWNPTSGDYEKLLVPENNDGSTAAGDAFGPELGISQRWMEETGPNDFLYINKNYCDGCPISSFQSGTSYHTMIMARKAAADAWLTAEDLTVVDIGWLWVQGEGDYSQSQAYYEGQLETLAGTRYTDGIITDNTVVVLSKIHPSSDNYGSGVAAAIDSYASTRAWVRKISYTDNFNPDNVHLNAVGQLQLGYDAFQQIFQKGRRVVGVGISGGGGSGSLQDVTNIGGTTSNMMTITGYANAPSSGHGLHFYTDGSVTAHVLSYNYGTTTYNPLYLESSNLFVIATGSTGAGDQMMYVDNSGQVKFTTMPSGGGSGTLQSVTDGAGNNKTTNLSLFTGSSNAPSSGGGAFIYGSSNDGFIGAYNFSSPGYTKLTLEMSQLVLGGSAGLVSGYLKVDGSGNVSVDSGTGGGSGEANLGTNVGSGGIGVYENKSGVTLQFNSLSSTDFDIASNIITVDASIARLAAPTFTTSITTPRIISNGSTPSAVDGPNLNATVTVVGNDVAGTITVVVNSVTSIPTLEEYATVTFATAYSSTPVIAITPANSTAGALDWYLKSPTTNNFSIARISSGTSVATTYVWTYLVIQ